jgi:hypothetical protein
MMQHDCEAAGIAYATPDGVADFHANRAGVHHQPLPQQRQPHHGPKLARHSAPELTSNVYSKITTDKRAEAIGAISFKG